MKIETIFIPVKGNRLSQADKTKISEIVKTSARRAARILRIKSKIITFTLHPHWWSYGGFAESKEWIRLKIPLRWKSKTHRASYFKNNLPEVVFHEIHHIARKYVGSPEKNDKSHTLLNSLVAEGLAVAFSEEQLPSYKVPYTRYREKNIKKWLPRVRKEKRDKNYHHAGWFYGMGKPKWLGYKIGKYIIDQIKKRNPKFSAAKSVRKNVKIILKQSGIKF